MLMFTLERMRVHNYHPIYHMRVGKQRYSPQIGNE